MSKTQNTGAYVSIISVLMTPEFEKLTKQEKEKAMFQIHQAIAEGDYDYDDGAAFPYIIDSIKLGSNKAPTVLECAIGVRSIRQVKQQQ